MKIGLLTYHHSSNIGAILQTYATCRALKELGHDVVIVDIRQPEQRHSGVVKSLVSIIYKKRTIDIHKFKDNFYAPLTRNYSSVVDLRDNPPKVDCLLVGSDQTWNPDISKEMVMAYFLDFGDCKIKRISYASSFGLNEWPKESPITADVQQALDRFFSISVRELTGQNILERTFGKRGVIVVDPTMLFQDYEELTGSIPNREEVVCYKLERTSDFLRNIGIVKQKTGLPLRLLNNSFPIKGFRYTYPPGVEEWLKRIGGAKFVITDSFHGTVFSILYNRNFVALKNNNGKDSRILDLLDSLGLRDRAYDGVEAMKENDSWMNPIDYTIVNKKVNDLRNQSWDYLRETLAVEKC